MTLSAVTTASFALFGENDTDVIAAMPSEGSCRLFTWVSFMLCRANYPNNETNDRERTMQYKLQATVVPQSQSQLCRVRKVML